MAANRLLALSTAKTETENNIAGNIMSHLETSKQHQLQVTVYYNNIKCAGY